DFVKPIKITESTWPLMYPQIQPLLTVLDIFGYLLNFYLVHGGNCTKLTPEGNVEWSLDVSSSCAVEDILSKYISGTTEGLIERAD
ncbi:MAG: hypothetical protein AMJ65_05095, partial [Phycisphaerae bacterium SG8_4]